MLTLYYVYVITLPFYHNVHDIIALKQEFPQSSDRVGNLPGTYTIHTDPSIPTVHHACHKVPTEYKEPIEKAL